MNLRYEITLAPPGDQDVVIFDTSDPRRLSGVIGYLIDRGWKCDVREAVR